MEAQEIFDKVAQHLAAQKEQSMDRFCLYRGPNCTKCAFGIFIPDDLYSEGLEGHSVFKLLGCANRKANGGTNSRSHGYNSELWEAMTPELVAELEPLQRHTILLRELQGAHDSNSGTTDWARRLAQVATNYGLEFDRVAFENQLNEAQAQ
jgi:hypothetical protein